MGTRFRFQWVSILNHSTNLNFTKSRVTTNATSEHLSEFCRLGRSLQVATYLSHNSIVYIVAFHRFDESKCFVIRLMINTAIMDVRECLNSNWLLLKKCLAQLSQLVKRLNQESEFFFMFHKIFLVCTLFSLRIVLYIRQVKNEFELMSDHFFKNVEAESN